MVGVAVGWLGQDGGVGTVGQRGRSVNEERRRFVDGWVGRWMGQGRYLGSEVGLVGARC